MANIRIQRPWVYHGQAQREGPTSRLISEKALTNDIFAGDFVSWDGANNQVVRAAANDKTALAMALEPSHNSSAVVDIEVTERGQIFEITLLLPNVTAPQIRPGTQYALANDASTGENIHVLAVSAGNEAFEIVGLAGRGRGYATDGPISGDVGDTNPRVLARLLAAAEL
jgi:predicted RecA/RadA family phage recombinase